MPSNTWRLVSPLRSRPPSEAGARQMWITPYDAVLAEASAMIRLRLQSLSKVRNKLSYILLLPPCDNVPLIATCCETKRLKAAVHFGAPFTRFVYNRPDSGRHLRTETRKN